MGPCPRSLLAILCHGHVEDHCPESAERELEFGTSPRSPLACTYAINSKRLEILSLLNIVVRWCRTVVSLINSRSPTSLFFGPWVTRVTISRSRSVNRPNNSLRLESTTIGPFA